MTAPRSIWYTEAAVCVRPTFISDVPVKSQAAGMANQSGLMLVFSCTYSAIFVPGDDGTNYIPSSADAPTRICSSTLL